jgi:hypothetical protein
MQSLTSGAPTLRLFRKPFNAFSPPYPVPLVMLVAKLSKKRLRYVLAEPHTPPQLRT